MTRRFFVLFTLLLTFGLLISGCSKKEDSPTETQNTPPTIPTLTFKGPNTNSTDQNPQMIKSYASAMSSLSMMFAPYMMAQSSQSGNTWTWNYTQSTLTIKITSTLQGDGSYAWKVTLNGRDPGDGTQYNNWTAMEGTTSADGKSGGWKLYEENKTSLEGEFTWATVNNVLTGTQKEYTSGVVTGQIVLVNNPDNSGEMRVYEGTVMTYKATWTAAGSGTWWTYSTNGTQSATGTWS